MEKIELHYLFSRLEIEQNNINSSNKIESYSPIYGDLIGSVSQTPKNDYDVIVKASLEAFYLWREIPAPKRGEIIRQIGDVFRLRKQDLGTLISYETGKSLQEGLGEVQEVIDICDFAVGLSRQLYGLTMHSERPNHRMYEQYHPLGVVGIISAFNFPMAVWAWNAMIAWVCGNSCVWKPSEKAPFCALACQKIVEKVFENNNISSALSSIIMGDYTLGERISKDERIPLVSATGSTRMGKSVAVNVANRLGRSLLELGGNNAVIITEDANLELAIIASVFGACGTAGQRCTTTRRLIVHSSIYDEVKEKIVKAYKQLKVGNPLIETNHVGPLIDKLAVDSFVNAIESVQNEGGTLLAGGKVLTGAGYESGCYVSPAVVEAENEYKTVQEETFAPILYLLEYNTIEEAIEVQNNVKQGLSSAIITNNLRYSELFLSCKGSDCGIANVNIGTSGAEIGGAFGGEKETGGGRESGSDAWKVYMRRQTNTINFGLDLPLAQGIKFDF